jgi:hypothetical protein
MRQIRVEDKFQIKQLLYSNCVLGIKGKQYRSFGGFQLWWYDKKRDICTCCQSHWLNARKKIERYSLDKAAKILWRKRSSLFLRCKQLSEDKKLLSIGHFYN